MTPVSLHNTQRRTNAHCFTQSHSLRCLCFLLFNPFGKKWFGPEVNEGNEDWRSRGVFSLTMLLLLSAMSCSDAFAGPRVDIVIGEKAPALEKLAADELAGQLKRVYDVEVKIDSQPSADSPHVIFVGSPDTNAQIKPFADSWPSGDKKLTDQGHLLKSVTFRNRPALLIGGGSPVATYWAVAEYGHRLGIRSLLFGDLDPVSPPEFKLDGIDEVINPVVRSRGWFFWNSYYSNDGAWSLAEYQRLIRQLAKLRFNQITVAIGADQSYLHLEYGGIKQSSSSSLNPITVSGDTAGRKAFGGAKLFETPAFAGIQTYAERHDAAKKRLNGIIDAGHEFGMTVHILFPLENVPREFTPLLANAKLGGFDRSGHVLLDWDALTADKSVAGVFKAHVRSLIESYPRLDGLQVFPPTIEPTNELNALTKFFAEPDLLRRSDESKVRVRWLGVSDAPVGLVIRPLDLGKETTSKVQSSIVNFGGQTTATTLPRIRPKFWDEQWQAIPKQLSQGFEVHSSHLGDDDLPTYWISRISLGETLSPQAACRGLLTPICGEGVDHRVWQAFELMQSASKQFGNDSVTPETHHLNLSALSFDKDEPVPASWGAARTDYLNAMNEMYRANTRAREGGRAFTLYLARRFEFAYEYMNCIEAVRKAGIAERQKDTATQIAELEKAIESLNNALNAMAAVARSNSDRGLIAVLNEHGYRPLKKKLSEAEEAK